MSNVDNLHDPVNMTILRDLEETVAVGIPTIMVDLINTFTVDCRETFRVLRSALESGDVKLVEINAHALKSSSATFGAESLSAAFWQMEQAARHEDLASIRAMIDDVAQEIEKVEAVLNAERQRLM